MTVLLRYALAFVVVPILSKELDDIRNSHRIRPLSGAVSPSGIPEDLILSKELDDFRNSHRIRPVSGAVSPSGIAEDLYICYASSSWYYILSLVIRACMWSDKCKMFIQVYRITSKIFCKMALRTEKPEAFYPDAFGQFAECILDSIGILRSDITVQNSKKVYLILLIYITALFRCNKWRHTFVELVLWNCLLYCH